jgi:hypothetical protein
MVVVGASKDSQNWVAVGLSRSRSTTISITRHARLASSPEPLMSRDVARIVVGNAKLRRLQRNSMMHKQIDIKRGWREHLSLLKV